MNKKIGLVSLGCPKNLVDSEVMLGTLGNKGYSITNNPKEAQVIIVNTCGFIESAKQESINAILEHAEYKKNNCELLIVTGCLAERYRNDIITEIPEVDAVVGTGDYGSIAEVIDKAYDGSKQVIYGNFSGVEYLENDRILSTKKGYAYLKIAEGCDNCCTYCIIPQLRGPFRSRRIEDIEGEALRLASRGVKEIILVAQDTTRYGLDIYNSHMLPELLKRLSAVEGIEWIRLLYCYPEEIDDSLIKQIRDNEKVCKYIDIPVQHASDSILKAMGRRGSSTDTESIINRLKSEIPGIVIRTSVIVGFPGEDESDFDKLLSFVNKMQFDRLGAFEYSREEGTPAFRLKPQVNKKLKESRFNRIMELQNKISADKNKRRLGQIYRTLVEGVSEDGIFYYGRTYAEAPDIDGFVYFTSESPLNPGEFVNVKILNADEYDLVGEVKNEFTE